MITYLVPIVEHVSIAIIFFGLTALIFLRTGIKNVFERLGMALLILGASSIFLAGIIEAFRHIDDWNYNPFYETFTEFIGMTICVIGVLLLIRKFKSVKRIDQIVGMSLVGTSAILLLIFTSALFVQQYYQEYNSDLWNFLNASGIISFTLVMIGILWIENSLARSILERTTKFKTAVLASVSILFIGTVYLFVPYLGIAMGGPLEWGTFSYLLNYLYFLGILLVLGITITLAFRGVKIPNRVNDMTYPSEDGKEMSSNQS